MLFLAIMYRLLPFTLNPSLTLFTRRADLSAIQIRLQLIQDSFLTPKIMGKVTGLNSAIILLSLSIWGTLLGVLGMIIALPMTTLMLTYYQRYIIKKKET